MNNSYQALQGLVTSFTRSAAAAEKVFALIDSVADIGGEGDGDEKKGTAKAAAAGAAGGAGGLASLVESGGGAGPSLAGASSSIDWVLRGEFKLDNVNFHYQARFALWRFFLFFCLHLSILLLPPRLSIPPLLLFFLLLLLLLLLRPPDASGQPRAVWPLAGHPGRVGLRPRWPERRRPVRKIGRARERERETERGRGMVVLVVVVVMAVVVSAAVRPCLLAWRPTRR